MSIWLTVKLNVALNRILDVFESLLHIRTLRMTTGQSGTTDGYTFIMCQERDLKSSFHLQPEYCVCSEPSIRRLLKQTREIAQIDVACEIHD